MPTRSEVLQRFSDWATAEEAAEAMGCPKRLVRSRRSDLSADGYLESRFVDGVGFQYRATGKALPKRMPRAGVPNRPVGRPSYCQDEALLALAGGPKTASEIAVETGCPKTALYDALISLERKGKAVRDGGSWRLAR